nr:MAG TPA: hypothetical protein [Bacteriophage sp.]
MLRSFRKELLLRQQLLLRHTVHNFYRQLLHLDPAL